MAKYNLNKWKDAIRYAEKECGMSDGELDSVKEYIAELDKQLISQRAGVKYLESFIKFCQMCHNPEDDCLCG